MGIPSFIGRWLARHPELGGSMVYSIPRQKCISLSFDLNSLLHQCAQQVYAYGSGERAGRKEIVAKMSQKDLEEEYHQAVSDEILRVVSLFRPTELLVLAVDGIAPLAKMQQQRQRRYRAAAERASGTSFDSNALTPGTPFMARLDAFLDEWVKKVGALPYMPRNVVYSSYRVPGEGEHKIFALFRAGVLDGMPEGNHIVYGLDADLVVLSLLSNVENIVLMREAELRGNSSFPRINGIDIDRLRIFMPGVMSRGMFEEEVDVNDFAVLVSLLGNDFIPHHPALNPIDVGMNLLLSAADRARQKSREPLTVKNVENKVQAGERKIPQPAWKINPKGMVALFEELAHGEGMWLGQAAERAISPETRYRSNMFECALARDEKGKRYLDYTLFRSIWYTNAFNPEEQGENVEEGHVIYPEQIEALCIHYMEVINWAFIYYLTGLFGIDETAMYPAFHVPLFVDVEWAARNAEQAFSLEAVQPNPEKPFELSIPMQILSVIPPASAKQVPGEMRGVYQDPPSGLFPERFLVEFDGIREEHKAVTLIDHIDIELVKQVLDERVEWKSQKSILSVSQGANRLVSKDAELTQLQTDQAREIKKVLAQIYEEKRARRLVEAQQLSAPPPAAQQPSAPPPAEQGPPRTIPLMVRRQAWKAMKDEEKYLV